MEIRAAGEGTDTREAWAEPGAFQRKVRIGGTGAHHDPVAIITGFLREAEFSPKRGARLQLERISAVCGINGSLKVIPLLYHMHVAGSRRVGNGTPHVHTREFCRSIK